MDDCTLKKLTVKPGKLTPDFNANITEYNMTVSSKVEKLSVDPVTNDTSASYSIAGSGGSKSIPLTEGQVTSIKIEVSAEDGTTKFYFIHAKRLSGKDANLVNLNIEKAILLPDFDPAVLEYRCNLPCQMATAKVVAAVADTASEILIQGANDGVLELCAGETRAEIQVTSADGSNKQTYTVDILRKPIPRFVKFVDPKKALEFECPFSLGPLYAPITIKNSNPKHTYSAPIIDSLTRTSKYDPLNGQPLPLDWRVVDRELDKKMSEEPAVVPLTYGGSTEPVKFGQLASQLDKYTVEPKVEDPKDRFQKSALSVKHKVESWKWEQQLQQVFDETDPSKLIRFAENQLGLYFENLPNTAQGYKQYRDGESPMDFLNKAIQGYATALKFKPKDPSLHLLLGMTLEEAFFAEDMFGLKKETHDETPSFNIKAKESSKEEEVLAICKLRGVDASAPVSLQLKALDEEYHHLLDTGQSSKADQLQNLFVWYSKKASQEGAVAHKAEDSCNPLGQAYIKYLDALSLEEGVATNNFHVGRLLVMQGNYEDAVKRLEAALCWNQKYQLARIYLGLALSLQKGGPGDRIQECVCYLQEGMETLLTDLTKKAATPQENLRKNSLYAENLVHPTNVHLLRGLIQLGRLLLSNQGIKEAMSPHDVFHTAALLASQALPTVYKADVYKQLEWVLLEAHAMLLEILSAKGENEELIAQRCHRLSALIYTTTIPQNQQLLDLQERTCQNLVRIQPCNSHALFLLGSAQMSKYENSSGEKAKEMISGAKASFEASINLQGKPSEGEILELISGQKWYQERMKINEKEQTAAPPKDGAKAIAAPAPGKGGAAVGQGAVGRSVATAPPKGAATKAAPAPKSVGGGPAPAGKGPVKPPPGKAGPPAPPASKPAAGTAPAPPAAPNPEPAAPAAKSEAPKKVAHINPKSFNPYLGLARVLRALDQPKEAQKYFEIVIKMAPDVHDAYIECAEMLLTSDPLAAVDVYAKFPVSEQLSFDDAYIFGEIVRILMKHEKYDDERLAKNMISYGRILGLGSLEKYVKILEEKFKNDLLKKVYAGVNGKSVDDPDMQNFFKFKCWA
ncbi:uncharacterized protein LOC112569887 isoform X2 [Pomacea canaliculata]|uniref:uncharacterized protein LOC112569887 isoform X2 n=1 Tax=Pomacea canaliculata TaxID=400727 RepID=UPI000D73DE1C|nr:uncharacterized protein LOC112569887 isoform X2 [Pomacea canaliculata]